MAKTPEPLVPGAEMFGIVEINGVARPILQRQATGRDACKKCSGFGTYGNPLCGAVYTCDVCGGSGHRPPSWWQRFWSRLWR